MAFRLQSAIAGAGKKLSEKMTAFDENYAETLKNTASNLAQEAADIRKERMIAVRDYKSKGQILMDDYGLSEAQVASLLQGGTDRYDKFLADVESGAMQHIRAGNKIKDFDKNNYIQNTLFSSQPTAEGGTQPTYMSLDEQAALYGKLTVPSTIDMGEQVASVVAGTQRGIFKMDPETVRSALGDVGTGAEQYEGPGFTPTGISYTSPALSAAQQLAFETAEAQKKKIETETAATETNMAVAIQRMGLDTEAGRRAERQLVIAENAEKRAAALAPLELEKLQTQIDGLYQGIQNDVLTGARLAQQIEVAAQTGLDNALLNNQLLQAKIISEGTVADAEALWATSVAALDVQKLELERLQAAGADAETIEAQQTVVDAAATIADENWNLVVSDNKSELFSKVNLDTSLNRRIKQAALGFNVELKFSSFNEAIEKFGENQLPAFLTATDAAIAQINEEYGDQSRAKKFVRTQTNTLSQQIIAYAAQKKGDFITEKTKNFVQAVRNKERDVAVDFGVLEVTYPVNEGDIPAFENALKAKARDENNNVIAKPGDIIRVKTQNGGEKMYMWGVANDWIGY
jgi:hypothetical protein|tara:strand:+ start:2508 stop:4232 length:1725 start_codon:yes stop_codon:yes gene_type:complete